MSDLFGYQPEREAEIEANGHYNLAGRYAEFMVCAFLTRMGYAVTHVNAKGFDIILETEERSYRVDVKSTATVTDSGKAAWTVGKDYWLHKPEPGKNKRRAPVSPKETDILALFHRLTETVVFVPVVIPLTRVMLPMTGVRNAGDGQASLEHALRKLAPNLPTDAA